jgi:hypothetical protein
VDPIFWSFFSILDPKKVRKSSLPAPSLFPASPKKPKIGRTRHFSTFGAGFRGDGACGRFSSSEGRFQAQERATAAFPGKKSIWSGFPMVLTRGRGLASGPDDLEGVSDAFSERGGWYAFSRFF